MQENGGDTVGGKADLVRHNARDALRMPHERGSVIPGLVLQHPAGDVVRLADKGLPFGTVLREGDHLAVRIRSVSARWKARAFSRCSE